MSAKVLVIGCGPAGLVAAHAANSLGAQIVIASKNRKSHMYGAQYLHQPIPGIKSSGPVDVAYKLIGSDLDYRLKVYGDNWTGSVSTEDLSSEHQAWDIREAYDHLWDIYNESIIDVRINGFNLQDLLDALLPDIVFNTIPADKICTSNHTFRSQLIKAAGSAPDRGIDIPYDCPDNTVMCNGDFDYSWYRVSNIFGYKTVEWPEGINPPIPSAAEVKKPLNHDCKCWPEIVGVGRYGAWRKGYLVHQVYHDVINRMG